MNKTKRELYEENKKLKKELKAYSDFWEFDAIEESNKQKNFIRTSIFIISAVLLIMESLILILLLNRY